MTDLEIPADLLPADGRFGAGPSKIQTSHLEALAATGTGLMGTSHRQPPVKALVGRVKDQLAAFFDLPEGYEVVLANGGTHAFWDSAIHHLIRERSQHVVSGEFGAKFATAAAGAPWLADPAVIEAAPGTQGVPVADEGVDAYAWTHNETSTGVMAPVERPAGAGPDQLVLVDATSGAGGLPVDLTQTDAYYFAPQKAFASDGGLWCATLSPAARERIDELAGSGRYVPAFLDLAEVVKQSRLDQTLNTPALATLFLMAEQLEWMLGEGGLEAMIRRTRASAETLYGWAEQTSYAAPYVADTDARSHVVGTIDFDDSVDAKMLSATLRANGVVDTEPYRKLGRNQLRIAMYPAIDPADIEAITRCIDWVVERLGAG